ncbi:hypothetical protein [Ensifer sp. WSM1721]|uniref:hypothetical protein n=1 Tax=Ensifer sp. WSM1721 TaxID=1041159 RepID=UPI0004B9C9D7|nr:hypothetical protein [Ensifer sp. WSM1721]
MAQTVQPAFASPQKAWDSIACDAFVDMAGQPAIGMFLSNGKSQYAIRKVLLAN